MIDISILPSINASLNGASAILLVAGYRFIRRRRIAAHKACMVGAFAVSCLFLASYLTYHAQVGSVRFTGAGWTRPLYFTILLSHTILAAVVPPMAVVTIALALRGRFDRHRGLARWTLPIWIYVSVTGVIVYWMLYHMGASAGAA